MILPHPYLFPREPTENSLENPYKDLQLNVYFLSRWGSDVLFGLLEIALGY